MSMADKGFLVKLFLISAMPLEKLVLALCLSLGIEVRVFGDFPNLQYIVLVKIGASV